MWVDGVEEAVNEFSRGPVATGLSSVATKAITMMLNSAAGRRRTQQR